MINPVTSWTRQTLPRLSRSAFLRQLTGVAALQAVQMVISAAIGFIIVRHLTKEQYAVFNLFNVGIATLAGFATIGVVSVYIPFAHRVGPSTNQIRTTTRLFRTIDFPLLVLAVIVGLVFWLGSGYRNGWLNAAFIAGTGLALLAAVNQYQYRHPESAYKVIGQPLLPFTISIGSELLRLLLVVAVVIGLLPYFPKAGPTMLMAAIAITSLLSLYWIQARFRRLPCDGGGEGTEPARRIYWSLLRPLLFPAYFYHSSQFLRGWLIYLISGTAVIAEAAALGRLMMLFAMMDKAVEMVIIPKLGAIAERRHFLRTLSFCFVAIAFIATGLLLSAWMFPKLWLWLLGAQYANLNQALLWAVAAAGVERLSGLLLFGQLARGETRNQWWVPVLATAVYIIYAMVIGLDTAEKATAGLFIGAVVNLTAQLFILIRRIRMMRNDHAA